MSATSAGALAPDTGGSDAQRLRAGPEARASRLIARFEHVPVCSWHLWPRVVMGSATFFDAFNALSLAFAMPVLIKLWHLTPQGVGWLIAASYIGQFAGALIFSRYSENHGRVPGAAMATVIMSVMGLACCFAGSFAMLFICRLVQGVGVGGEMPIAATYVSELSPARGRGRFFLLYELIFPVGLMITGQVGANVVPVIGWWSLFVLGSIPGLVISVMIWRLPESPRWLIGKGRLDEAERNVGKAESVAARKGTFAPLSEAELDIRAAGVQPQTRTPTRWREVLSLKFRTRTLVAWGLWASAFFVANSLNNWMPTLYRTYYHLPLKTALRAASLTNVAQVVVLLAGAFLIDRIGRRWWTGAAFVVGGLLMAALALNHAAGVGVVIVLATLAYGVIGSNAAVLYLYTPEIYPTRMRAVGTGLATSWLRVASAIGPTLVGLTVAAHGVKWVFVMFAGVSAAGALLATRMLETRGKRLEDIAS